MLVTELISGRILPRRASNRYWRSQSSSDCRSYRVSTDPIHWSRLGTRNTALSGTKKSRPRVSIRLASYLGESPGKGVGWADFYSLRAKIIHVHGEWHGCIEVVLASVPIDEGGQWWGHDACLSLSQESPTWTTQPENARKPHLSDDSIRLNIPDPDLK